MIKLKILLSFLSIVFAQKTVELDVIARPGSQQMELFERDFINLVISTFNKRSRVKSYNINFLDGTNFFTTKKKVSEADRNKMICAIRGITIVESSEFEYSYPYFPINNAVIVLDKNIDMEWKKKGARIAILKSNAQIDSLRKKYGFILIKSKNRSLVGMLESGEVDFFIGDSVSAYFNQSFRVKEILDKDIKYLGLIYPKGSILKKEFDPIIKYLSKSPVFYNLLKKYCGNEISDYYESTMKLFN